MASLGEKYLVEPVFVHPMKNGLQSNLLCTSSLSQSIILKMTSFKSLEKFAKENLSFSSKVRKIVNLTEEFKFLILRYFWNFFSGVLKN